MIITRKIQLLLIEDDKTRYNEQWAYLRTLNDDVFKAANLVVNNQFYNEIYKDRLVMADLQAIDKATTALKDQQKATKDKTEKDRLKEAILVQFKKRSALKASAATQLKEEAGTSQQNMTYQIITEHFPNMPSYVRNALNNTITSVFSKDYKDVMAGKRSLRNYKKN